LEGFVKDNCLVETFGDETIKITKLELGPFGTNCYIVECLATRESLVVDAPGDADRVLAELEGTKPQYIVITHNHFDHIVELDKLRAELGIPVAVHPLDAGALTFSPDLKLNDGDIVILGRLKLKVLHMPGHTPGSICLYVGNYLIAGDTIFPGGPGKTGSPADLKIIIDSIVRKIFVLPDNTEIFPGHGQTAIVSEEKEKFAVFKSKSHDSNLCGDVLWLSS
jgi:glyoxylase-like metal-dependent hydrolase (beta-lactamase superfamily II)